MNSKSVNNKQLLVDAAINRFHADGYARASLADVAKQAGVPKGNVYYYFKTKEDLAIAVVDEWCSRMVGYLALFEAQQDSRLRIEAFIDQAHVVGEMYVSLGCPLAGMAKDLRIEGGQLAKYSGRVYAVQYDWLKKEFLRAGIPAKTAREHTRYLMSAYHGAILLAHAISDIAVIEAQVVSLKRWLRTVLK